MYGHVKIIQVYARSINGCIGIRNRLPWECLADLKRFRQLTKDQVVVMGRKTFESLPAPLKNRKLVIVVSRDVSNREYIEQHPNHVYAKDLIHALDIAVKRVITDKVFIIGGRSLYLESLDVTDEVDESVIGINVLGDTFIDWEIPEHISVNTTVFDPHQTKIISKAPIIV